MYSSFVFFHFFSFSLYYTERLCLYCVCLHASVHLQFWPLPSLSLVRTIRRCVRVCVRLKQGKFNSIPQHTPHEDTATPQLSFQGNSKQNYCQQIWFDLSNCWKILVPHISYIPFQLVSLGSSCDKHVGVPTYSKLFMTNGQALFIWTGLGPSLNSG